MTGSHEVSGSIPLISTRKVLKSHDFRTFSLLSGIDFFRIVLCVLYAIFRTDCSIKSLDTPGLLEWRVAVFFARV